MFIWKNLKSQMFQGHKKPNSEDNLKTGASLDEIILGRLKSPQKIKV